MDKDYEEREYKGFKLKIYYPSNLSASYLSWVLVAENGCQVEASASYIEEPIDDKSIKRCVENVLKHLDNRIFTEEELISPCSTIEEFEAKMNYLKNIYAKQVRYYQIEYHQDFPLFDPVSCFYLHRDMKEFVNKHIQLYKMLNQTLLPTVFPMTDVRNNYSVEDRFFSYYNCIPFAEPDDPVLSRAKKYVVGHAKYMIEWALNKGERDLAADLIQASYIKQPTLKKLLEMANEKEDTQLAALILEQLKDTKQSKSKFSL